MFLRNKLLLPGFMVAILFLGISSTVFAEPVWSIEGEYFEGCTCNPGCPCLFGSEPTHNKTCKITGVFHINKGKYGQYNLDGQTVIGITDLTARPDENWIVFYINEKVSVADNLTLDVEILRGKGDSGKPTQIINKNFSIWAKLSLALQMNLT